MNVIFLCALALYFAVFIIIGVLDTKKIKNFEDFCVAGRSQTLFAVSFTLLATVIGASTTIGITDTVCKIGFPGIWWLAFGGLGLVLQSVFLSKRVRETKASTLPDLAGKTVGNTAKKIIGSVIVISWIGVVAGQLAALNSLVTFALGKESKLIFICVSIIVIIYTMTGGQLSVVKTDKIQFLIILAGIIACVFYLYLSKSENNPSIFSNIELLNDNYRPINLLNQLFVIGGVYFLGPDILSRNFMAKDAKTAKKSALISGLFVLVFSFAIAMIGMWIKYNVSPETLGESGALMVAIAMLPKGLSILMTFGLLSAILSSTDTCIINASTIFVKDILNKDKIKYVRITVLVIGLLALLLTICGRGDIVKLLTGAYSIYTPGVIFPLAVGIFANKKFEINTVIWLIAVIIGGLFGIAGTYLGDLLINAGISENLTGYLPLIGMGASAIISILSVKWHKHPQK